MNPPRHLLLILSLTLSATLAHAMDADEERLTGFAEHQSKFKRFDEARDGGKRAFLEEQEQWDAQKQRELVEYKKNKPVSAPVMNDKSSEYHEWEQKKKAEQAQYEETRQAYAVEAHKRQALDRKAKGLPTLAQELGIDEDRPRFDFAKRNFGAKTAGTGGSSPGGFGRGSGGSSSSGNSSFPPPPTFDDFQDGYVPAPNISPEDFGDVPPPPPPPMAPTFDNNGFGNGGEFIPPPPPPPGNFESGDF